jgi:hypothetical protein
MKQLLLILPIVLLGACANRPPKKIVIVPATIPSRPVDDLGSVRRPDEVREYRFGRYVDPGSRTLMHEAHPIYRIERPAQWNLSPDGRPTGAIAATPSTSPDDAVVAEINKQKAATKAFTDQAATLNQRLAGLTDAITQTKRMAEQQLLQQRDIAALQSRLNAVERERSEKPAKPAAKSPPTLEESW